MVKSAAGMLLLAAMREGECDDTIHVSQRDDDQVGTPLLKSATFPASLSSDTVSTYRSPTEELELTPQGRARSIDSRRHFITALP